MAFSSGGNDARETAASYQAEGILWASPTS
jgi:hypothetical protein